MTEAYEAPTAPQNGMKKQFIKKLVIVPVKTEYKNNLSNPIPIRI